MSVKSKIAGAVAALTLATSLAMPTGAQAHGRAWAIGAAILGSAVVGAAIANSAAYGAYYDPYVPRRCRFERQYDAYGFYIGTVRVCRYF